MNIKTVLTYDNLCVVCMKFVAGGDDAISSCNATFTAQQTPGKYCLYCSPFSFFFLFLFLIIFLK